MTSLELLRLSLVRFAASFVVVLTTGVLNRLVIADLGVAPLVGALVLACQNLSSPLSLFSGWLSDRAPLFGRKRTPYIVVFTSLAVLPLLALPLLVPHLDSALGLVAAGVSFAVTGFGLKAANLLVNALIVDRNLDHETRGRHVSWVWVMSTIGFILAGLIYAALLRDVPAGPAAAHAPSLWSALWLSVVGVILVTAVGVWGLEPRGEREAPLASSFVGFRAALADPAVRGTLVLLAVSDAGFFMQDLILEPFGAEVLGLPLSATTASFNVCFGAGMMLSMVAAQGLGVLLEVFPTERLLTVSVAIGAAALAALGAASALGSPAVAMVVVFVLGAAKGLYNTAISHRFTRLAAPGTAGVIMGAWGAVGGFAMALGGLLGGALVSLGTALGASTAQSYGGTFVVEATLLVAAVWLTTRPAPARQAPVGSRSPP